MTPAQKTATLEEALNKETDRRGELDSKVAALTEENSRLASAKKRWREARHRPTANLAEHAMLCCGPARFRVAARRLHQDDQDRRALACVHRARRRAHLRLLVWLLLITRKLEARVHDVPTLAKMHEYEGHVARLHEQIHAERVTTPCCGSGWRTSDQRLTTRRKDLDFAVSNPSLSPPPLRPLCLCEKQLAQS